MALHNFSLLYVEDDKNTQESMRSILEDEVKVLYQAYNGKDGLSVYKDKKPDIVLTDISMPAMNGLEMASAIKDIDKMQPIVITSAFDDKNIMLEAVNIGIDGFVVKPVNIELLMNRLEYIAQNLQNRIDVQKAREKAYEEKERRLYELAHYDALTSIPNRFLFEQKLDTAIEKAKRESSGIALFFIDLDNFKTINDTYGHKAGDAVLVNAVKNIKSSIRNNDFIARIGGDEFALIVENILGRKCLEVLAGKIIKAASNPVLYHGEALRVSCSIGIEVCDNNDMDRESLIHNADIAMYSAKKRGKSDFAFYQEV